MRRDILKALKENATEIIFLIGVAVCLVPAYMIDLKLGLALTGAALITISLTLVRGGD